MNKRRIAGTTLIELLVVIVVFMVGILAFVQIFPSGLDSLRLTRQMTGARAMVRSMSQQLAGQADQAPEYIGSVQFAGSGAFLTIDTSVNPNEFMPPLNDVPSNEGRIRSDGQVLVAGSPIGHWAKVSGANRMSRVIGEGRPVGAPQVTPFNGQGSLMQLNFAPVYYVRDPGTGVGTPGLLTGYSNDLAVRVGDVDAGVPDSANAPYEPWSSYFIGSADATGVKPTPFIGDDQVWIRLINDGVLTRHDYRLKFTMNYDFGGAVQPVDVIVNVPGTVASAFYNEVGEFGVISLPEVLGLTGGLYLPANYRGVVLDSLRIQRLYREIPLLAAFSTDPLEYKVTNDNFGTLLVNPLASGYRLPSEAGQEKPLSFKTDYTVFDWRIIRDDFTVPTAGSTSTFDVKLVLNSIKPLDSDGMDRLPWGGLSTGQAGTTLDTPSVNTGLNQRQDFILFDMATGGVITGNDGRNPNSAYVVDKSRGYVTFRDVDGNAANGMTANIAYPDPNAPGNWNAVLVPLNGRRVRAMYASPTDLALQVTKAASNYAVVYPAAATTLGAGQVYPGGASGWGLADRLYFPVMDLGQRVTIGEVADAGQAEPRNEQQYRIDRIETVGGVNFAVAQLPFTMNVSGTVVPVKRVKGSSLKVRALWNSGFFNLDTDEVANYEAMKNWAKSWRKTETTAFLGAR